jgi:hypothetical protein
MPTIALVIGGLLTALGVIAYTSPDLLGTGKTHEPTALSPAVVGVLLMFTGLVSLVAPQMRKHAMHAAAILGLLGTLGGFMPMVLRKFDFSTAAVKVGLGMTVLSAVFLALCIKSFIDARRRREALALSSPS